ncbi:ABC transporter substrate-binding protein [Micromonospora sediminimaris]|uniref:ABC transporter substrate-binding protein n=1 Tax=Micromonospora sediminimaris TaxID=547162 RepID=A0A9W5XKY4_9ACTN|nr:ABC transporter substrate-binding protein [Micromonospora sediminimaris]GIJ34835.1 ABC transporter substrate-binding protein [Micromonospora sediminimaris]SFD51102.1 peptide/nickel transport system substrate-binding protein [Micromonospora sediminimaris]
MPDPHPRPRPGGTLRFYGPGGLDHLDPAAAYYAFSHQVIRLFARQLFSYPTTEDARALVPVPDVAAELPTVANGGRSADGRSYTLRLRDGVYWDTSPQRAVTAADFVRGFKRMANPVAGAGALAYYTSTIAGMGQFVAGYRARFAGRTPTAAELADYQNSHDIAGLRAVDDRTLVIDLVRPANDLLNLLAMPFASAAPHEYDQLVPDSPEFIRQVRSNGPYRITSYVPGSHLTMAHNPAWRPDADPIRRRYVDRIDVRMARVSDERVRDEITSGRADLSWGAAVGRPRRRTEADRNLGWALNPYLVFNLNSPRAAGALRRREVRLAIAYAIDKARLVRFFDDMGIGTVTRPAHGVIPPGNVGHRDYDPYPTPGDQGDRARCRQLLAEAGYPDGLTLTMIYRIDAVHGQVAKAIAEDLAAGGIDCRLVEIDQTDEYYRILQDPKRAAAGEWDITPAAFMPDWFGNNGRSYVQPMFQSNTAVGTANYGGYHNPLVDDLIDRALSAPTEDSAAALWHQVDRQVLTDVAIVPILVCEPTIEHLTSARVRDAIPLPHVDRWYDAANLWLDPPD